MTNLQQGHQYSLSNKNKNNKSVVFVKLTDSALKSIETFLSAKVDSSSKPTIQFQNNSGIISLPSNGISHKYGFTLSNIEGDKVQSSFQCLQHIGDNSLESLGFIFKKLQIHATEDSYEQTKSKMAAADQEQKNLCTKELRQTVARMGNKVNIKRPGLMYIPEKTQPNGVKPEPTKFNLKNEVTSPATFMQHSIRQRIIHILAAKAYRKAELILRLKREGVSEKDMKQINDILVEVAKVKGNVFNLEDCIWNEVQEDWELSSKQELQLIKKKKQQFSKSNNVNGVTGLAKPSVKQNAKLSIFEETPLNKKLCQYVNGNRCKSIEKPILPKNGISHASKRQSAAMNHIGSLLTSFVQQQHSTDETNSKKKEMLMETASNGHDVGQCEFRPSNPTTPSTASNGHNNGQCELRLSNPITPSTSILKQPDHSNVPITPVKQSNKCSRTKIKKNSFPLTPDVERLFSLIQKYKDKPSKSHNITVKEGNKVNGSCLETLPIIAQPLCQNFPEFDFSEIHKKYTKVESLEQRSQYVKEFNHDFEEYVTLQPKLEEISERFIALNDELSACAEGSPEYQKIRFEIGREYKGTVNNCYLCSKKKFDFLRKKLTYIKKLILEYDKNMQSD